MLVPSLSVVVNSRPSRSSFPERGFAEKVSFGIGSRYNSSGFPVESVSSNHCIIVITIIDRPFKDLRESRFWGHGTARVTVGVAATPFIRVTVGVAATLYTCDSRGCSYSMYTCDSRGGTEQPTLKKGRTP